MDAKIEQLTPAEQEWIQQQIAVSKAFVEQVTGKLAAELPSPEELDLAFNSWLHSDTHEPDEANEVVNCVGVAVGQHIINKTGLEWVIASDSYGTELAVYGLPGKGDILVYPQNLVAKRYESKTGHFIAELINKICSDVAGVQKQGPQKKWWKPW